MKYRLLAGLLLGLFSAAAMAEDISGNVTRIDYQLRDPAFTLSDDTAQTVSTLFAEDPVASIHYDNLWDRIRGGFAMQDVDSPLVTKWENYYAARPDYLARIIDRSSRYLYYVTSEVEKRGMPMEFALLPMIESAYNPKAESTAKAAGMWQFIPETGKRYGLERTWWYDGRRDVVAATQGALDYLQELYGMFGDWQLVLASYNWGENGVARSIAKKTKPPVCRPITPASACRTKHVITYPSCWPCAISSPIRRLMASRWPPCRTSLTLRR